MKKLFSALLSLSLFAGIAAMPAAAADAEFTAEEIRSRSAELIIPESDASYMAISPVEDDYVNYYLWSSFEGIAVLCEDAAALEGATMGDYTFTLNGSSTAPYGTICVQSYEDMLAQLQRQGSYDPSFYEVNIEVPAQFADQTDHIYMLQHPAAQGADFPDDLLNGLMEDERFAIIGITQVKWRVKAFYGLDFTALHLVPEPGCVIDAAALATEEYGSLTYSENRDYWWTSYMPLEDAIALCETLEARDDIVRAWPSGEYYPNTEYYTVGGCKIYPLFGFPMGDANLSGEVNTEDALMILREYIDVEVYGKEGSLTDKQRTLADVAKTTTDTVSVDSNDALEILRYYVYTVMNDQPVSPDTYFADPDAYWDFTAATDAQ